jgi:hypothetical protein
VNELLLVDYLEPSPAPEIPDYPGRNWVTGLLLSNATIAKSKVFYRNVRVRRLPDTLPDAYAGGPFCTEYDREILRLGGANYPVINYHVHLKGGLTLGEALAMSRQTGVFYGIAVNCGLNFSVTNDAGIYELPEYDARTALLRGHAGRRSRIGQDVF